MSFRLRVLTHLQNRLGGGELPLRIAFWDGQVFDFAPSPQVTIGIRSPRVLRFFLTGDIGKLTEAYVGGDIAVDGRLQDVLRIGTAIAERIVQFPLLQRFGQVLAWPPRRYSKRRDAAAISHHYDVSNQFYALWLDRNMIYSCAYYETGAEDIDTAQEQKLDHICRKLRLSPGDSASFASAP